MNVSHLCVNDDLKTINVLSVISKSLNIEQDNLTDDLHYQSIPEWDSLRHINLMLALEKAYEINIDADLVPVLVSVKAIKEFIYGKKIHHHKKVENAIHRGLNGINYDNSSITLIDGQNGKLFHRGYSIQDLAQHSSFEELSYLLLNGRLPQSYELDLFTMKLIENRVPPKKLIKFIRGIKKLNPTDALRTIVSSLPMFYGENIDPLILISQIPFFIAAHYRMSKNEEIIFPHKDLSHAANFLYMLKGEIPKTLESKTLDQDLILHAEHGSNASTFVGRVVTSTGADVYAAMTAAIAAFSGALHGGALEKVFEMLREIDSPHHVQKYIEERIQYNLPIYGYGHRVYRTEDPRATILRKAARTMSLAKGNMKWLKILEEINSVMQSHAKLGMNVNVDFYAAVTYHLLDIPDELFVPVFIMSRVLGWTAHIQEQIQNNILIRPRLNYVGKFGEGYLSINDRR